jgi:hypothetical protein
MSEHGSTGAWRTAAKLHSARFVALAVLVLTLVYCAWSSRSREAVPEAMMKYGGLPTGPAAFHDPAGWNWHV